MIEKYPSKVLLEVCEECSLEEGIEVGRMLTEEAKRTTWGNCVGLAAPQIGVGKKVFMALDQVYINPEIFWASKIDTVDSAEGCYSLDENNHDYHVQRSYVVKMRWTNVKGEQKERSFAGLAARVMQHEFDHLNGILCNSNVERKYGDTVSEDEASEQGDAQVVPPGV